MSENKAREYLADVRKSTNVPEGDPDVSENIRLVKARLCELGEDKRVTSKWLMAMMRVLGTVTDEEMLLILEHYDSTTGRPW